MNESERTRQIAILLDLMHRSTNPDNTIKIFNNYLKRADKNDIKPIFNLFADSYLSVHGYCALMKESCWSQAGAVLRSCIEQISCLFVLTEYPSTVTDFLKIAKQKREYYQLETESERKQFIKDLQIKSKRELIEYFDYGWVSSVTSSCTRDDIISLAKLDEVIYDIKTIFNSFAHGKLTIFDFAGPDGSWSVMKKYGRRANMICAKLFDYLCCAYKKWTSEEDVLSLTSGLFINFKELYVSLLRNE